MSFETYKPAKLFTVDQANATMPLVRAITADLANLARDVSQRRQRLDYLMSGRDLASGDPYGEELSQMHDDLRIDMGQLQEYVSELRQLGVEPKGLEDGLVDFPCMMDGRIVYLCWKLGEPEVLYWHELDGGFGGRRPLTADSVADAGLGDDALEN